jgi:hypothetical protein
MITTRVLARNILARDILARNILARNILARNILTRNILARNILARNILAGIFGALFALQPLHPLPKVRSWLSCILLLLMFQNSLERSYVIIEQRTYTDTTIIF